MAVVGEASIVVRAITTGIKGDIKKAFDGVDADASSAGGRAGNSFRKGFANSGGGGGLFSSKFLAEADAASTRFTSLARVGLTLQPAITGVVGAIGALGSGLVSLVGVLGAAAPGAVALGTSLSALAQGAITAKLAFAGVANAIKAGTKITSTAGKNTKAIADANLRIERAKQKLATLTLETNYRLENSIRDAGLAQLDFNDAIREAKEELQQTRFAAEDAALGQQGAALALAKARDNLAKTSDLPAGSRARQEALLELAQAELKFRQAVDRNNDAKEASAKGKQVQERAVGDAQRRLDEAKRQVDPNAISSQAYDDEKALASARQEVADAQKALNEATKGGAAANQAYSNALSGLSKEAQSFVKYIVSIQSEFKKLQAAAGKNLFPDLEIAIQNLVKNLFPTLKGLLEDTGGVLGKIAKEFSKTITEAGNLKNLESVWKTNDIALASFGKAGSNLYTALLNIAKAAEPLTLRFSKWIETLSETFKNTTKTGQETGELTKKFKTAGDILADIGIIFKNVFGAFGQIIKANVGPGSGGQILLDYFKDATERFKNLLTAGNEDGSLKKFFADAAKNATKVLSLLGNIVAEFVKLGGTAGTGKFIDSLNKVVDILGEIGANVSDSGGLEAFGKFLEEAATAAKKLSEGSGVKIFFSTLTAAVKVVNKLLEDEFVKALLTASTAVFAFLTAIGFLSEGFGFLAKVIVGKTNKALGLFGLDLNKAQGGLIKFGATAGNKLDNVINKIPIIGTKIPPIGALLGPAAIAIGVIAGAAFLIYNVYKNSEALRTSIEALVTSIKGVFAGALKDINAALASVFGEGSSLTTMFKGIGDVLSVTLIPILTGGLSAAIGFISGSITGAIQIFGAFKNIIEAVFTVIKTLFKTVSLLIQGDFKGALKVFTSGISDAFGSLVTAVKRVAVAIVSPIVGIFNAIIRAWNATAAKFNVKIPDWIPKGLGGGQTLSFKQLKEIDVLSAFNLQAKSEYNPNENQARRMALGGTVLPSPGGLLARIGEAGRAERVEPLDPDGLSKRDKAMIQLLSGGAGSGVTVNVYPSAGMNERELASVVSRQLALQFRTGAA